MSAEGRRVKALRLLAQHAVTLWCSDRGLVAHVRGDHGEYSLVVEPDGWACPCPYPRRDCSHARAVELVAGWRRS